MKISLNPKRDEEKEIDYLPLYLEKKVKHINGMIDFLCPRVAMENREPTKYNYEDFCKLVRESVELFNTLYYVAGQVAIGFPARDKIFDVSLNINKIGNVTQIQFDRLLPLRIPGYYLNESMTVTQAFWGPLGQTFWKMVEKNNAPERKDGWKDYVYSGKVVLCFMHHLAAGSHSIGYHGYEVKRIIDGISMYFLRGDDGPRCVSYYCEEEIGGDRDYSEIFIVPYKEFPEFLKNRKAEKKDNNSKAQITGSEVMQRLRNEAEELTIALMLPQVRSVVNVVKENKDNDAMITEMFTLMKQSAALMTKVKMAMYQSGIGSKYNIDNYSRLYAKLFTRRNGIRIVLNDLIEHRKKGFTCAKPQVFPEYYIKGMVGERYVLDEKLEYVVCFRYHYGPKRRLRDHDNMETLPYFMLITGGLPRHVRDSCRIFIDAVTDDESTYTEIIIMPKDQFTGPDSM